jgi:hypothetical protein
MHCDQILQELEDRFRVDPISIYERAADALALQQQVCDKMFRALCKIFEQTEPVLTLADRKIVQESLQSYEMLNTFFGGSNE